MTETQRIVDEVVDRMDLRELMRADEPDWREICERNCVPYRHANVLNPGANNRGRRNDRIAALRGGVMTGLGIMITLLVLAWGVWRVFFYN
jgi:hypothetical protein